MDPYAVLGVSRDADDAQIKAAFRNLAKQHHPDKNPGDATAEAKFKEISTAFSEIETAEKREALRRKEAGPQGFNPFGGRGGDGMHFEFHANNMEELMRQFHAHQNQPRNKHYTTGCHISLLDAFNGCEVSLKSTEREIRVKLPPGVDNGTRVRVAGGGEHFHTDLPPGDLFVSVSVEQHPQWAREGKMLISEVVINAFDAILGGTVKVPLIEGTEAEVQTPAGIQTGYQMRLAGKGMPIINRDERGDHIIVFRVVTPENLTDKQLELVREIKSLSN